MVKLFALNIARLLLELCSFKRRRLARDVVSGLYAVGRRSGERTCLIGSRAGARAQRLLGSFFVSAPFVLANLWLAGGVAVG